MTESLIPVEPVVPVAPWLGGKRALAKRLCALIDQIPCTTYAEPFVGMGGIFLRRSSRPRAEVINDAGRDYGKHLFSRQDFQRLSDILTGLRGQFVLSINDVPEIRQIFAWARIEEVRTTYTIGSKGAKAAAELIIRGGTP